MILWILVISTILLFISFVTLRSSWYRVLFVAITGVLMVGSVWAIHENDEDHLGMKRVTTTTSQVIYSASPSKALSLLLHQDIGTNGKHSVYIYKTASGSKAKTHHTKADYDVYNRVTTTQQDVAQLQVTRHEWVYKNDFAKLMFNDLNNHQLIKQTNTFKIPTTWYDLTTSQAKQLAQQLKKAQHQSAAQKAQLQAAIKQQVAAAVAKNPSMTQAQQQALVKQLTAKYQQAAIAKAVKAVQEK
ncbi:DUF4811 domain-containing protein [Lacticaseibacillus thailandensis]|uniref:DUF4811 domain-containing protein n=1 Tax=Lacticaseibacillus thailandensis DSM 22698 = JCM 13996 TaxID=1423810 RepID=A0A0R2CC66_9LACO|nr:DUF4811 domain-containing protein [Lacticaseibacillus thailandensis]KRM87604.1 hypothetical protein FD19_GL001117 [Lacticaseibacillus thailandensis DSM 22698 = JCM 13996]